MVMDKIRDTLSGENMRDFNEMEASTCTKVSFVIVNLMLVAITAFALAGPVWIMGLDNNPYTYYFHEMGIDKTWQWKEFHRLPEESKMMMFIFAVYAHVIDLPLSFLRLFQAMTGCCKGCGGRVLVTMYGFTHIVTPTMYLASIIIAWHEPWGKDWWFNDMGDKHGKMYPYYMGAALAAQLCLRIFLLVIMQSPKSEEEYHEEEPLVKQEAVHDEEDPQMDPPLQARRDRQKAGCCK